MDPLRREYDQTCHELAAIFGAKMDSFVLHQIEDVLAFERALANVYKLNFHLNR